MVINTNWYVISGGPCSGKTKTIERLAFLGYHIVPEAARILIDNEKSKGKTEREQERLADHLRSNQAEFQEMILKMQIDIENRTPKSRLTFFERGIPDGIAYRQLFKVNIDPVRKVSYRRRYKGIFLLEQLRVFRGDSVRNENEETAGKLSELLNKSYTKLGYDVIRVPLIPIDRRVEFILDKVKSFQSHTARG